MEKIRVYELSKQLNTTSKRLIEKLAEIGVEVKNHMSFLSDEEKDKLYRHIGIIKGGAGTAEPQKVEAAVKPAVQQSKPVAKEPSPAAQKHKPPEKPLIKPVELQKATTQTSRPAEHQNRPATQQSRPAATHEQTNRPSEQQSRPPYQQNRSSEYQHRSGDYQNRSGEQQSRPPYQNRTGDQQSRPPYQNRTGDQQSRPPYQNRTGDQQSRPPYQNRTGDQNSRPPYQNRSGDYQNRSGDQQSRPPYQQNRSGDYQNRSGSTNSQFQRSGNQTQGQRPQRPAGSKPTEGQKPIQGGTIQPKRDMRKPMGSKVSDRETSTRRDMPKGQNDKFRPQTNIIGQKKGVSEVLSEDFILNEFYQDGTPRLRKGMKGKRPKQEQPIPKPVLTSIKIGESITVRELAESLKKTAAEIIKKLMGFEITATLNQELDFDIAYIVAEEYGVKAEKVVEVSEEDILFDDNDDEKTEGLEPRPPVVVVMGHVDHGKTSLLDAIRETNVIDTEAGGITQHIGAYTVKINNKNITFLDTPGHEAFTAMRARGAQVTDIAILVVAADDGMMPQTLEAVNHAKAANVAIIVAVNKMDKPGANPDKVKQQLAEQGLIPEEWGGEVAYVPISAKKRTNIDQLLEMVLLTAEVLELKADPKRQAKGTIIEAKLDKDRGAVATMLVQRGTLRVGDSIVTGTVVGRIRAMTDDKGHKIKKAGPSTPVEILGLPAVPEGGQVFYAIQDEKVAKSLAEKRKFKQREQQLRASSKVSLTDLFNQIKEGKVKDLNLIVKADVQGSVEAVKQSLQKLTDNEVRVNIIHGGVGAITESDVMLAKVSNAIIIGFNVRPGANVADIASDAEVEVKLYDVIYKAIEDIQAAMKGMLDPEYKEVVLGHAEVRQTFKVSGIGVIAGAYITDGKLVRNADVRVIRDSIVIHQGKLASLKRFKDDAKEVLQGFECGLSVEKYNDIKESDVIEAFTMEQVKRQ